MTTPSDRSYSTYRCESTKVTATLQKCSPAMGTRTLQSEPPRSTAYYYADLERLKRKNPDQSESPNADELSEYVESNEVVNDGPIREVPPLRDRQWSLPEYNTPENSRKGETYSTAGTFPMPEPKEKEPLLAELEVVGRLPLTQLETASGVRRSRSWYLCCPNMGEEEISRESSWRYSSLRPVTAPPVPGQNGMNGILVATHSSARADDPSTLKAERDALSRALAAERARAAAAARAHDARLAELHGVIAELVRRRARDKRAGAIPEEEGSDECESTTQPAGELDNDADRSRTEQNESSSILSPSDLPTPQEPKVARSDDTDTSTQGLEIRVDQSVDASLQLPRELTDNCDTSLNLSERDSEICLSTARCCQEVRGAGGAGSAGSCERERGSSDAPRVYTASPGRCEARHAKVASRVRLRRADDTDSNTHGNNDESWCAEAAERLALDVCAQADLREALVAANHDGEALTATLTACRARCSRLQADCAVLQCALARAADTQHRLYCACAVQESWCVALCVALHAADRALETYDVLLALAESRRDDERAAAQLVARQVLARLDAGAEGGAALGEPLLSPGPWLQHDNHACAGAWSAAAEARLRRHAARLKADTVRLRPPQAPTLFSYHDIDEEEIPKTAGTFNMAEMEAAVMMQEVLSAREARAMRPGQAAEHGVPPGGAHGAPPVGAHGAPPAGAHGATPAGAHGGAVHDLKPHKESIPGLPARPPKEAAEPDHARDAERHDATEHKVEAARSGRRRARRHWLEAHASETDL